MFEMFWMLKCFEEWSLGSGSLVCSAFWKNMSVCTICDRWYPVGATFRGKREATCDSKLQRHGSALVCVCMLVCVCVYVCRSQRSTSALLQVWDTWRWTGWPESSVAPVCSALHLQIPDATPGMYVGAGDPDSGSCAYMASTLLT